MQLFQKTAKVQKLDCYTPAWLGGWS